VELAGGSKVPAKQQLEGGPSVLFDAVALVVSEAGATQLATMPAARDFVADAFAHNKFIGHTPEAALLLEKAGVTPDAAFVALKTESVGSFLEACRALRFWERGAFEKL
jgi:catalase